MNRRAIAVGTFAGLLASAGAFAEAPATQLFWGDTHVHTSFSLDANLFNNLTLGPEQAYRFARGEVIDTGRAGQAQLDRPLDFLVISDHAAYMGVFKLVREKDPLVMHSQTAARIQKMMDDHPLFGPQQITELAAVRDDLHVQLQKSMDLGNGKLCTAARIANEMVNTHAKELRTTKETTSHAIAKTKAMRAHAHGFAELMLEHAASDKAPGHIACWTAFSGLLDDGPIGSMVWAGGKKKKPASSHSVYDIAMFNEFAGSATMHSPTPHVAY